jgi:acyl-CoA dehydrogenase
MGRVPWSPEVFNCAAPDTGNMETIERYGSEEQKDAGSSRCSTGKIRSAFLMTEPAVASRTPRTSLQHQRDGNDYVINGRKWWSSGANDPRCKIFILMGKTNPGRSRHRQQSMILVPSDTPGVKVLRTCRCSAYDDAPHGHAEVLLENVRVPASQPAARRRPRLRDRPGRLGRAASITACARSASPSARSSSCASASLPASRSASRSPRSRSGTSASPSRVA